MIDIARLVACAVGEDDAAEEHILGCAACAERFAAIVRLGSAIATLVRTGELAFVATRALVDRLDAAHLISRRYALAPGSTVPCAVGPGDIFALTVLEIPATTERVDLVRGTTRFEDVPVDGNRVYLVTPSSLIRTFPSLRIPFRAVAGERTLAEYTLDHTAPAG